MRLLSAGIATISRIESGLPSLLCAFNSGTTVGGGGGILARGVPAFEARGDEFLVELRIGGDLVVGARNGRDGVVVLLQVVRAGTDERQVAVGREEVRAAEQRDAERAARRPDRGL
jgi:hypothetical protein